MTVKRDHNAVSLAQRAYQAHIFLDETTDSEPIYVAVVPEMPGCIAHGDSFSEALEWLDSAKLDHIEFLLDHGMEVPKPQLLNAGAVFTNPQYDDEENATAHRWGTLEISAAMT